MGKLYYSPGACSLAVHIVLEWIVEPYELVKVGMHHLDPNYARINPAGAVPAYDDGRGRVLTQCVAILTHLAQEHSQFDLLDERSAWHRADVVRWVSFLTGDLHPASWPVFLPRRYTVGASPEALNDVKEAGLALLGGKLAQLERQVGGGDWIVGGKRTIADAYATPMLAWGASMLPEGLAPNPSLRQHREHMLADRFVRRAMLAEGLPIGSERA